MTANFFGASSADVESMALSNPFCKDVHVFNSSLLDLGSKLIL